MSRYAALDLSTLPQMTAIEVLSFDAMLAARLDELEQRLAERFTATKVAEIMALARNIAASPMRYLNEAAAAREIYLTNRLNEAVRAIFLASAREGDLDQIGANRGVVRKILDDSDPDNPVLEDDDEFRARIQLVIESYSPHGTEGSYVYWALDADDRVRDVAAYGPNHEVTPAIVPGNAEIVILSREGDGSAPPDLIDAVHANLIPDKRRPVADKVTVLSATPVAYRIEAELQVTSAEAAAIVLAAAQASVAAFVSKRLAIGRKLYRTTLAAALKVDGVVDVIVTEPPEDVPIGPYEAPHCTDIALTVTAITGGWWNV
ncbi:baseplate J/gp47 family protein [Tropicimonas sp. IMCC34043]|uniref:baseplate assembly protein n=1 Tax=Tropicimonas sp. IMCC34043 TaxID=2248760 RepID=UPI000E22BD16|nr:baseplate J/gp47 family protein [Tropicimonas sp. IMCC34043]